MSEQANETTKINETTDALATNDVELLRKFGEFKERFLARLEREIVGRRAVLEEVLAGIFAGGHVLLVGVPGLGKTRIARAIADALDLRFRRIQFTPDLTPADILGFDVLQEDLATGTRSFSFAPGPIFANVVLADEINRTPPKTQAALLEATQERQVTVAGRRYELDAPFFVVATQNPLESEGTYPLPDAQLDRFLFSVKIDYPRGDERAPEPPTICRDEFLTFQGLIRRIPAPRVVVEHAVNIVRKTRPQTKTSIEATQQYVERGAGPRASQALILGAKAFAAFAGRTAVSADDVERAALPALRERIALNYLAQADGVDVDFLVRKILRDARAEYERG